MLVLQNIRNIPKTASIYRELVIFFKGMFSYHTNHIWELNARVSHGYQRLVENFQRNGNFHGGNWHCVLCETFHETFVEYHWEMFHHRFCNYDHVIAHDARKLVGFEAYILKIEILLHNVHRFWFLKVWVTHDDSQHGPKKSKNN